MTSFKEHFLFSHDNNNCKHCYYYRLQALCLRSQFYFFLHEIDKEMEYHASQYPFAWVKYTGAPITNPSASRYFDAISLTKSSNTHYLFYATFRAIQAFNEVFYKVKIYYQYNI